MHSAFITFQMFRHAHNVTAAQGPFQNSCRLPATQQQRPRLAVTSGRRLQPSSLHACHAKTIRARGDPYAQVQLDLLNQVIPPESSLQVAAELSSTNRPILSGGGGGIFFFWQLGELRQNPVSTTFRCLFDKRAQADTSRCPADLQHHQLHFHLHACCSARLLECTI